MKEFRREDAKSCEKFGEFYAVKDKSYIGYFKDDSFLPNKSHSNLTALKGKLFCGTFFVFCDVVSIIKGGCIVW